MLDSAEVIAEYLGGDVQNYRDSRLIRDAVHRNLEIIGEAAKRCPEATRAQYPDIPWRGMAGLRDVLIHDYDGTDPEEVVPVLTEHLPRLREQLTVALKREAFLAVLDKVPDAPPLPGDELP
ncbi:DUF86 domain-containing protein [Deinococcus radiodurans]|nr:DUF86 domain-containing protein [Deinococcus radiodurans]QIP33001.1 DUF86 domain-containing protein [Deinococcus radiodurans]